MKRVMDICGAFVGLALSLPVVALAALAIAVNMGRPIFFRQMRRGLRGKMFNLYKLRTMNDAHDENGELLPDAARLTPLGRLLRRTSIDELPQLWNVLRGEMSLVGPRPLFARYYERYDARQIRRHDVKPGITGWAQINGRNAVSWTEKFEMDLWYVEHQSVWLDLKILAATVGKFLRQDGISQADHATMPEFLGTPGERS